MSKASRINHIVKALHQKGFYTGNNLRPGTFNSSLKIAVLRLHDSKDNGEIISVPLNALRTIYPEIFSGVNKNCTTITNSAKNALSDWIKTYYPENAEEENIIPLSIATEICFIET